ncbi:hypothetical protein AVEN_195311-1 [Araneus ventricosus]|uniref:Uncharacterized protein n=1 Tax=Araneus ventricosus TaxID=182803 RepID=A0A4Y2IBI5_ARAVE|nr:hypothetical protein AVEN_195311-1 [Araneus ventricosus]
MQISDKFRTNRSKGRFSSMYYEATHSPLMWCGSLKREVPAQVSSSSSDRGSKLRGPSLNSVRVASKRHVNTAKLKQTKLNTKRINIERIRKTRRQNIPAGLFSIYLNFHSCLFGVHERLKAVFSFYSALTSGGSPIRAAELQSSPEIILKDCIFVFILIGLLFHFENSAINENGKKVMKTVKRRRKIKQELRERRTRAASSFAPPTDPILTERASRSGRKATPSSLEVVFI